MGEIRSKKCEERELTKDLGPGASQPALFLHSRLFFAVALLSCPRTINFSPKELRESAQKNAKAGIERGRRSDVQCCTFRS